MTMSTHLMKKIEIGLLKIIGTIISFDAVFTISSLSGDLGVEKFLNWLAECDRFYKYTGISYSRMVKTTWFI